MAAYTHLSLNRTNHKKHTLYFPTQINQKSTQKKKNTRQEITMNKRKEKNQKHFFYKLRQPFHQRPKNIILPTISLLPSISPKPLPLPILSMMPTTTPLSHKRRIKMSLHPTAAATATATPPHLRPTYNSSRKKTSHQNTNNLSPISNHRMLFKNIFIFPSSTFFNEKDVCANDFVRHTRSMNNAQVFFFVW
jgi:hypothetical protein